MISRGDIYYADLSPVLEQIRTIDKVRFQEKLGTLDDYFMKKVNEAIKTSLDLK